ncbi:MAG: choice-of-anchor D domain-containing protein [Deltaproteobacteria bacterium]|nr:choice-of-anchor D domain-containing protein [Deltaproteobacteria bacterium]
MTSNQPMPKINVTSDALNFGSVKSGVPSTARTVTIKNTGTADLEIGSIALSGMNPGDFGQYNCCATLRPKQSCIISVQAKATSSGGKSAILSITSNAANDPVSVKLSASVAPPKISATPSSLGFGKASQGITSAAKTVKIKNTGASDLSISSIQITGTNPDDFSQTNDCASAAIPAGAHCTLSVTFTPDDTGARSAVLGIASNDPKKPTLNLALSGQGSPIVSRGMPGFNDIVSAPKKIRTAAKAVVRISTARRSGTGFFISSTGKLMTNNHVLGNTVCPVEGCYVKITYMRQRGEPLRKPEIRFAKPVAVDAGLDMAVVQLYSDYVDDKIDSPDYLTFSSRSPSSLIGNHVTIVGHPEGNLKKWTDGVVAFASGEWFQSTAFILPGDSGSPVLNDQGQVVGLIHRGPASTDLFTETGANVYSIGTASESLLAAMNAPLPDTMISTKASATVEDFLDNDLVYLNAQAATVKINSIAQNALSLLGKACDTALARDDFKSPDDLDDALKPCYHAQTWIECRGDLSPVSYGVVCPDFTEGSQWAVRFKNISRLWVDMTGQADYDSVSFSIAQLKPAFASGISAGGETLSIALSSSAPVLDYYLAYYLAAFDIGSYDNVDIKSYVLNYRKVLHYELEATYIALAGYWLYNHHNLERNELVSLLSRLHKDPNISIGTKLLVEDMKYQLNAL